MFDYHEQKVIEELKSQLDLLEKQFDYHKRRMTELETSILSIEDSLSKQIETISNLCLSTNILVEKMNQLTKGDRFDD
jgi:chaperonin cofactor prefoldin